MTRSGGGPDFRQSAKQQAAAAKTGKLPPTAGKVADLTVCLKLVNYLTPYITAELMA